MEWVQNPYLTPEFIKDGVKMDKNIIDAHNKALYCANSKTGKFKDSKGYKILMEEVYKKQREIPMISAICNISDDINKK